MSYFTHSEIVSLQVRDTSGQYRPASSEQILAAARQAIEARYVRGAVMNTPSVVREYLQMKLCGYSHEVFAVLLLDSQNRLLGYRELFRGTLDSAAVYPREVVKEVLARDAAAVILGHNHPSGMPEPSAADRRLTERLREALALVDVRVLDHIVVGGTETASFAERGWL